MTLRDLIRRELFCRNCIEGERESLTASQLTAHLRETGEAPDLSNVASVLKRMLDAGVVTREEGLGVKGGAGYRLRKGRKVQLG